MQFNVQALKPDGSILTLSVEALDASAAAIHTSVAGMQVLSVRARRAWRLSGPRSARFPLLLFSQELLALLNAGITVVEAMETLAEKEHYHQTKSYHRVC